MEHSAVKLNWTSEMDNAKIQGDFPGWKMLEDTGAGDGLSTECERCDEPGTPRQQCEYFGVVICHLLHLCR